MGYGLFIINAYRIFNVKTTKNWNFILYYRDEFIKRIKPRFKNIFDRERPTLLRLIDITGFSFPSGHAMGSTSYFGSIIYILNRTDSGLSKGILIGLAASLILMVSTSRVYLGVHYPTDIIAGIIGGAFSIVLSTLILNEQLAK